MTEVGQICSDHDLGTLLLENQNSLIAVNNKQRELEIKVLL